MRVTEKGQVTIPLSVRTALGVKPGSEVEFSIEGDHAVMRRIVSVNAVSERLAQYSGKADSGLTTAQILKLTRL